MARTIYVTRRAGGLYPDSAADLAELNALVEGEIYRIIPVRPRNPKFHRKAMSLLRTVFDCQESYTDFESFYRAVLVVAGFVQTLRLPGGVIVQAPESIAWDRMDEDRFKQCYSRIIDALLQGFLPDSWDAEALHQLELTVIGYAA